MPRQKNYKSSLAVPAAQTAPQASPTIQGRPATACIVFTELLGEGARVAGPRGFDLTKWLGLGIDQWVWGAVDSYVAKLRSGTCQTSTVNNESHSIAKFFEFLLEGRTQPLIAHPRELTPLHVTQFVAWLRRRQDARNLSSETTRSAYKGAKSTFVTMMEHGLIAGDPKRFFTARVLPHKNFAPSRAQPYSEAEQQRLATALKADLIDLHHGRLCLPISAVLSTYFLVVAMRSGCNVTPLLELRRDGIRPGLLPGTKFLQLHKHRGSTVVPRVLKRLEHADPPLPIPIDAVAILERALGETAELATMAPAHLRDRVWLFRSQAPQEMGVIKCLRRDTVSRAVRSLVSRRNLLDDSGNPLQVLTTRFRQSLSKRAWRVSDGDPLAVAAILGNTPRVADSHYLRIDEQLKTEAGSFMGRELSVYLRSGTGGAKAIPIVAADAGATNKTLTPTGRCKDSLYGEHAPKNGESHCDQFVLCLFCPSFAVAGEPGDLWRLYSFQRYALAEINHLDAIHGDRSTGVKKRDDLRDLYEAAIPFIDRFCEQSFGVKVSADAKAKAQREIHPFWKHQMARSEIRRSGVAIPNIGASDAMNSKLERDNSNE